MNWLSTGFALFGAIIGTIAVFYAFWAANFVVRNNKASITLAQLTKIQTELTEHADSIKSLHESLAKLRSRVGMRQLREKQNTDAIPDSKTDPQGWKNHMRLQLHNQRFGK